VTGLWRKSDQLPPDKATSFSGYFAFHAKWVLINRLSALLVLAGIAENLG
jgi:hypothetical protein